MLLSQPPSLSVCVQVSGLAVRPDKPAAVDALVHMWVRASQALSALFAAITLYAAVCWGVGEELPYNPHLLPLFVVLPPVGCAFAWTLGQSARTHASPEALLGDAWRTGHLFGRLLSLVFIAHVCVRLASESSYAGQSSAANLLMPFVPLAYVLLTSEHRRAQLLGWLAALPPSAPSWRPRRLSCVTWRPLRLGQLRQGLTWEGLRWRGERFALGPRASPRPGWCTDMLHSPASSPPTTPPRTLSPPAYCFPTLR